MSKLHDKAAESYNAKLAPLPTRVCARPQPSEPHLPPSGKSDLHIAQKLTRDDILDGSFREFEVDHTGETKACYFTTSRGLVGLSGEDHDNLLQVTKSIASNQVYRDSVSSEFVYEQCVNWLQSMIDRPTETCPNFTDYLEKEAAKAVRKFEVWLPIPVVKIANPFEIGRVTFRRITKEMMDELAQRMNTSSSVKTEVAFDRKRSQLQGVTAACVAVEAEPIRGNELGLERAEASIAILRLACPAMLDAFQWAPVDPSFIDRLGASIILHIKDRKIVRDQNSLHKRMLHQWPLRSEDIVRHTRIIWGFGHNLLVAERNEFQETLLNALIHYSRSILKSDTAERLLYIVTALESVFIKSPNESIIQNLRERMAALAGPTKANRLKTLESITRVYDLRSGFVHRALPVSDMAQLQNFFLEAWSTFIFILNNHNKWRTKADFLRMVDEHKFSGPMFSTGGMPTV